MDFKRIEAIFLAAFGILNLFLFVSYQQTQTSLVKEGIEMNTASDLERRLKNDTITWEKSFSKKQQSGYYLAGENGELLSESQELTGQSFKVMGNKFSSELSANQQFSADKKKDLREQASQFLLEEHNVLYGSEYVYSPEASKVENQLVFVQNWEGIPFHDDSAELVFFF